MNKKVNKTKKTTKKDTVSKPKITKRTELQSMLKAADQRASEAKVEAFFTELKLDVSTKMVDALVEMPFLSRLKFLFIGAKAALDYLEVSLDNHYAEDQELDKCDK